MFSKRKAHAQAVDAALPSLVNKWSVSSGPGSGSWASLVTQQLKISAMAPKLETTLTQVSLMWSDLWKWTDLRSLFASLTH